jgi:hypothetical protein
MDPAPMTASLSPQRPAAGRLTEGGEPIVATCLSVTALAVCREQLSE